MNLPRHKVGLRADRGRELNGRGQADGPHVREVGDETVQLDERDVVAVVVEVVVGVQDNPFAHEHLLGRSRGKCHVIAVVCRQMRKGPAAK